jgi:hypothetical protein
MQFKIFSEAGVWLDFSVKTKSVWSVWLCTKEEKKGRLNYEKDHFCSGSTFDGCPGDGLCGHLGC